MSIQTKPPRLADLRRAGWRLVKVPELLRVAGIPRPVLYWGTGATWLAIPPDDSPERARVFGRRDEAARWAGERLPAHAAAIPSEAG